MNVFTIIAALSILGDFPSTWLGRVSTRVMALGLADHAIGKFCKKSRVFLFILFIFKLYLCLQ